MTSRRLATLNPDDILNDFRSKVPLKNLLGKVTKNGVEVQALSLDSERPHDQITAGSGIEVDVDHRQAIRKLELMDGRTAHDNELTIYVANYSGSLSEFDSALSKQYGYGNVTKTSYEDGDAYATGIGAPAAGYFAGIVEAASYKLIVGVTRFSGIIKHVEDAPNDEHSYVRHGGSWVMSGSHGSTNIDDAAGYFFQNSHYFSLGLSHESNPDVIEELEADVDAIVKFSDSTAGESGEYLQTNHQDHDHGGDSGLEHFYNRNTGVITLHHALPAEFVLIRLAIDINPDSDNSSANIILRCTANAASGGFTFDIEEQLSSLDQGAEIDYPAVASIPIFIGDTLKESPAGSPATITPIIRLKNTSADVKPRSLAFFIWS